MADRNSALVSWSSIPANFARDLLMWGSNSEAERINLIAGLMIVTGAFVFVTIMNGWKVVYGRYAVNCSSLYGFKIDARVAWFLQIWAMAFTFCVVNGFMQSRVLTHIQPYQEDWLKSPQFVAGVLLFFTGMAINVQSDAILRSLRDPSGRDTGYKIPRGGMFEYVSAANLLGEIVEWFGFALAQGGLAGAAFAWFTACNIGPRGWHHHLWYRQKFPEYPPGRRAVIPFLF